MTITADLTKKRIQNIDELLRKYKAPTDIKVRVGAAFDVSGSAQGFYSGSHSVMQETIDRLLAVALKFDDNGELDAWLFSNRHWEMPGITMDNINEYVQKHIANKRDSGMWYGTDYAPILSEIANQYQKAPITEKVKGIFGMFAKKPVAPSSTDPAMVLFITDGANGDRREAARVLREAASSHVPVYWNMIGIGSPSEFSFIQEMAGELPNVGFISMSSLNMTDEQLYEQLISEEFCQWLKTL